MIAYIARRLLLMIPTVLGILLITFSVIQFVPGGPVEQVLQEIRSRSTGGEGGGGSGGGQYRARQGVDPERIKELQAMYGFDKPAHERFLTMVKGYLRFDLGKSFFYHSDVWDLVKSKLPVSISLGVWTFLLTYLISIPLGIAK